MLKAVSMFTRSLRLVLSRSTPSKGVDDECLPLVRILVRVPGHHPVVMGGAPVTFRAPVELLAASGMPAPDDTGMQLAALGTDLGCDGPGTVFMDE